jgi:hypothetical protein
MSTVDGRSGETGGTPSNEPVGLKLEVVIPVADANRSKAYYAVLGGRSDAVFSFDIPEFLDHLRFGFQNPSNGDRQNAATFAADAGADRTAMTVEDHRR